MNKKQKNFVETYQCPGCVCGHDTTCFESANIGMGCGKHVAGTMSFPVAGTFFLGMPKGFCRIGKIEDFKLFGFDSFPAQNWAYDKFNVPVWKYLDENGNTLVRGLSPRINSPFLHVFLGNLIKDINCLEITKKDLDKMD